MTTGHFPHLRLAGQLARHRLRALLPGRAAFDPLPRLDEADGTEKKTLTGRPAHFEGSQLSRVLECGFSSSMDWQFAKLSQTSFPERPLQFARLGPAIVAGGQIFAGGRRHFMSNRPVTLNTLRAVEDINEPVLLANSQQGLRYFGHWLRDDCAMQDALRARFDTRVLSMRRPEWKDAPLYEDAFGQTWDEREAFQTPALTVVRDLGFSRDKGTRLRSLRARLRQTRASQHPGQVLYLTRGPSGTARDVANEPELHQALERRGVRIVHPEAGTSALIEAMIDAAVIITVEGSQAAHAVYTLADRGALLILQPPRRFYNPHLDWTRLLDMEYGIVVGEDRAAGFHIYPDEVLTMVDRLLAASAARDF